MDDAAAVSVRGLRKEYGRVEAVKGVDFDVAPGEVFGLLGPNGAGKSTTINMLCTLIRPTGGSATVGGHDIVRQRDEVRRDIGLVFQEPTVDGYLTGAQNLGFHAELYGLPKNAIEDRMRRVLDIVGLWKRRDDRVHTYSGGMRRRLEIARGLLHSPRVLFLDEPTVGLDPQTRAAIWGYIAELRELEKITVFMTTHYLEEAEYCDRIAIIDHGAVVALDTPEALKATVGRDRIRIHTDDDEAAAAALRERFLVEVVADDGGLVLSVPSGEEFVPRLFSGLGVPIRSVQMTRPSLDDVFLAYTGSTIRDAEDGRTADVRDAPDAPDAPDAANVPDALNTSNALNTAKTADAPDTADTADALNTADSANASDTVDKADDDSQDEAHDRDDTPRNIMNAPGDDSGDIRGEEVTARGRD
ncbi:ATP-binding cassette domain-containing protein [Streptosporangium sp. NPDC023615]|uniref:ATP-binding cassette domain-containing protein n=1 Tax=Streptosporangium sp. NPDC023615 TaxID=3154794 RepID=UPI003420491C